MAAAAHEIGSGKKSAPAQPWSHAETMHLIDAYEERWTALRRGQLKAHQWEEVAADVAARCAATPGLAAQRKTGTQCRHKLEKLRKRYRTEGARPVTSLWPYFRRMERLERGPLLVSAFQPSAAASPPAVASDGEEEEEEEEEQQEDEEEEDDDEELAPRNNTRSINGIIRESGGGFSGFAPRHPQLQQQQPPPPPVMPSTAPPRKRVAYEAFQAAAAAAAAAADKAKEEEVELELARRPYGGASAPYDGANSQLSAVLRDFGEGIMRLERRRMEVQREIERGWKETDARHAKMLQDAQRQLRDTIIATCAVPLKKARRDYHGSGADGL